MFINYFKYVNCCADGVCGYGSGFCCKKLVCKKGCNFKLKCNHICKVYPLQLEEESIKLNCNICNHSEYRELMWYGISIEEWMYRYG